MPVTLRLRSLSFAAAVLSLTCVVHADYVWLARDASGAASAHVGELGKAPQPAASVAAPRAFLADGKDLPLTTEAERFVVPAAAAGDLRLVASRVTDKGVLNYYQARLGRTETKAVNDLELVPTEPGGNSFKLFWKGHAVAATQVNVDTSEGWRRVLAPAADGSISLGTPFPGLYVLEVTAKVNGAVTVDGKKYEDVRHTATLSFEVAR
jgi:hypothetical protein